MNQSSASRLLLVENDPKAVSLMRPVIEDLIPESAIFQVETLEAARHALSDATFVCIVARAGAGLLAELLDHPQSAPIVCLTEPTAVGLHLLRRGIRDALELQTVRRLHEESELRGAAKRVPDVGHFELDADFTPVFVNELCHELTGLTQGDGDSFRRSLASVHPDDLPAVYAAIDELGAGRHVHTEHRRLRPGGSETTTNEVRIAPVVGADGRVVGYVGDVVDVTERRRVEARERSSRAQLQAIFDNSPSAMWFKDNDSRYVFANNLFGEYFQYPSADFDTMRDEDLWPADVAATVRSRDAAVIASGASSRTSSTHPRARGALRRCCSRSSMPTDSRWACAGWPTTSRSATRVPSASGGRSTRRRWR
jgi:PAS domain S-box-containing protein